MKKKGFTLIELLAVIVILAIIAVIATPIILNMIEKSRTGAKENSTLSIVKAVENFYTESQLTTEETLPLTVTFPNEDIILSGETPTSGSVTINADGTYNVTDLVIDDYICNTENITAYCKKVEIDGAFKEIAENSMAPGNLVTMTVNGRTVTKVVGTKEEKLYIANWVWYSGQLWQIVEFADDYVKLVAANSVSAISYGDTNTWSSSWVRKWLNEIDSNSVQDGIYYHNLSRTDLLLNGSFCLDEPSNIVLTDGKVTSFTPISSCSSVSTDKIGLLTFEDYVYALDGTVSGSLGGSFLDEDEKSFTMTKHGSTTQLWSTHYYDPSFITYDTSLVSATNTYAEQIRPVIYLSPNLLLEYRNPGENEGEDYGTALNPYILMIDDRKEEGDNLNTAIVGSYIYLNEEDTPSTATTESVNSRISYDYDKTKVRYRVIGINSDGTIKIQRANIFEEIPSTIAVNWNRNIPYYFVNNGENNTSCGYINGWYIGGCATHNYFQPTQGSGAYAHDEGENLGYYLNNTTNGFYTWFSDEVKANITTATWNLTVDSHGVDYARSLFNIDTSVTYPSRTNDGTTSAKIGLPMWGEMFSGNDLNVDYWLINRVYNDSYCAAFISADGTIYGYFVADGWHGVRPVLNLSSTTKISSGEGTMASPYILSW